MYSLRTTISTLSSFVMYNAFKRTGSDSMEYAYFFIWDNTRLSQQKTVPVLINRANKANINGKWRFLIPVVKQNPLLSYSSLPRCKVSRFRFPNVSQRNKQNIGVGFLKAVFE